MSDTNTNPETTQAPKENATRQAEAKKPKAAKKTTKPKAETALVTVKAGAMSVEVGPAVVAGLAKANVDEAKANELLGNVGKKRYDLQAQTTLAVIKAAKADDTIDLSVAVSGDRAKMNKLHAQLGLALGLREFKTIGKGDKAKQQIVTADAVKKFFPAKGDKKDDPSTQRKATLRSNFTHMLNKCILASHAIIDKNIDHKLDKESGTLLLSGPAIDKAFGAPNVVLNEKQTVPNPDKKGDAIQLKAKPSFTAIASIGKAGSVSGANVGRRAVGGAANAAVDPQIGVVTVCESLVKLIEKLPANGLNAKTKAALEAARNAIDTKL